MASLHLAQEIFNLIYPVGSVYISVNDTNPGTLFGGTWSRITDGYLFCGGTGYGKGTQSFLLNSTRTADTTLTVDQIPSHKHAVSAKWGKDIGSGGWGAKIENYGGYVFAPNAIDSDMSNTGGGQGHSHPIPTTAVSVWKRTA